MVSRVLSLTENVVGDCGRTENQVEICVIQKSRRPICVCERDLKTTFSVSRSAAEGLQSLSCPCGDRLTHHHHWADSHQPPSHPPPPSPPIPGTEATFCLKCCTWRGDISLQFIQCLSNSIFFSESVRRIHKWHQDDNYYNYVLIQRRHCGIVSVSFSPHNCGTSDGLIAANTTSWAIIHHPPHFFSLSCCWTMLVTFVGVIRLIQLMKRRGNTK